MEEKYIWLKANWLNQITCILELVLILICIHGVFKEKFKFTRKSVLLTVLELIVLALVNTGILATACSLLTYVLIFIYCLQIFKRKILDTIGKFVLSFFAVGLIEIVASIITIPLTKVLVDKDAWMLLFNVVGVLISVILFNLLKIKIGKKKIKLDKAKRDMLIIMISLYLVVMLVDYRIRGQVDQLYYFLFFIACVMVCFVTMDSQKARYELDKKKTEIEMQKIYGDTYKELILEVRQRQHDFKNQLAAIYSMHLTATSLDELVEQQRKYGDVLIDRSRYDKMLFGCSNSIIAGYLYYRFINFEKQNIRVDYKINIESAECRLSLIEIIEILGILTTNAAEHYEDVSSEKTIKLTLQETLQNLYIEVSNRAQRFSVNQIENMFCNGYSTKGKERGIGLPRVKELALKVDADIIVDNKTIEEENWIIFAVVIPKKKEGE